MKAKMFHILHMHAPHSPRKLPAPPIYIYSTTPQQNVSRFVLHPYVCVRKTLALSRNTQRSTNMPGSVVSVLFIEIPKISQYIVCFFVFFLCLAHSVCCLAGSHRFSDKHKIATIFIFLSCILFGADTYEYPCSVEYVTRST